MQIKMFYFVQKRTNLHKIWLKVEKITYFFIHARQHVCNKYYNAKALLGIYASRT